MANRNQALGLLAILLLTLQIVGARTYDQPERGSFSNPSARSRPFFRYWLPDASADPELVAQDISSAGEVGAGGVEFLPFYNYGGDVGKYPAGADWSKYGFGTPAFQNLFRVALQAHKDNDMVMDFALGPNQGQGVPADPNDGGLKWDLVPFASEVSPKGKSEEIKVPGWGTGKLVSVVAAVVTAKTNVTTTPTYWNLTVSEESLKVLTSKVSRHGSVVLTNDNLLDKSEQWIFAFYERQSLDRNLMFPAKWQKTIWDNGSFTVDHFSRRGADTIIDFWEQHVLPGGNDRLLSEVGNYGWEDSLELGFNISWTPGLPRRFQLQLGYSIYQYLPLLIWSNNNLNIQSGQPGKFRVTLDTPDGGARHINAFRATLQSCYQDYLQTLSRWAKRRLGLAMSAQVSYNLPMDMAASVPFVDVPECESLQARDNTDGYRQFSGAAQLAGQRVVSNEMGAGYLKVFKHQIPELLRSINRAFAGGVNRVVIHGMTFAHNYFETTWPGYVAWQYVVSEPYSNKFPSWKHGFNEALEYVARTQHVLQSGKARVDIAIYNKVSASDPNFKSFRDCSDLLNAGFSYSYISPNNLDLPTAIVRQGVLGPDDAAFKVLVVPSVHNDIGLDDAKRLVRLAKQGMPIVVEGDPKVYPIGKDDPKKVEQLLNSLYGYNSVVRCGQGEVVKAMNSISITPRVSTLMNSTLQTVWRDDDDKNGISYLYLYADNATSGYITINKTAIPYVLDAWSGKTEALLSYTVNNHRAINIPISLAKSQSMIIGLSMSKLRDVYTPRLSLKSVPQSVLGVEYSGRGDLILHVSSAAYDSPGKVVLSNGDIQSLTVPDGQSGKITELKDWKLVVEHWESPKNLSDASPMAVKTNRTYQLTGRLAGWSQIPKLANASGVGFYQKTYQWFGDTKTGGAYLNLPPILQAAQVVVNGHKTQPVNCNFPRVDMGPYLRTGNNNITIITPSTMWNYLRTFSDELLSSGAPPLKVYGIHIPYQELPPPAPSENGLVGPVTVTDYAKVHIRKFY
ncbi:hypothetical protein LCI18_014616 [Fusarium solani-melongenae]|uniref:Uncharacterized protein n=1 Tax=Fusarium solani subsp. cucurbitae TaxID=2747967 RepID=A0ACD3ZRH0_FUSSC|nr:hypothetical protein LCI18_014616 [Fusarium solani-melongenae]